MRTYLNEHNSMADLNSFITRKNNFDDFQDRVDYVIDLDEVFYNYEHDYSQDYFTIWALEDLTIRFVYPAEFSSASTSGGIITSLSYSTDEGETWTTENFTLGQRKDAVLSHMSKGDKILLKGNGEICTDRNNGKYASQFISSGKFCVSGNILSLKYGDNFSNNSQLYMLNYHNFFENKNLVSAEHLVLPSVLADSSITAFSHCEGMFSGCTSLVAAPSVLPALNMQTGCYMNMFSGCVSLTKAPRILATDFSTGERCCEGMFSGCISLKTAPELLATTLGLRCYASMFSGCTSLVQAPALPATTLTERCYNAMFEDCISLTEAPELPATTLTQFCYWGMFEGCWNLSSARILAENISATQCIDDWLKNVNYTGTLYKKTGVTLTPTVQTAVTVPSGWTVVDI